MMMILGMFVFSVPTATYQSLQRTTSWKHASNSRVGDAPAYQFTGRGEDTINLEGSIVPEFGSQVSITALRMMGDTGMAFPLIAGNGKIYGLWKIDSVDETQTYFYKDGTPRKIEFNIKISKTTSTSSVIKNALGAIAGGLF